MSDYWQIEPTHSSEYFLEIIDPDGWYSARVKWDGCIDFYRYYNVPLHLRTGNDDSSEKEDYIHLCAIDEEIARLQALKRVAYNYFEHQGRADHAWEPEVIEGSVQTPLLIAPPEESEGHVT